MRYVKYTCSNGFAGCEEEFYTCHPDDLSADSFIREYGFDVLYNEYSFIDPDERFCDMEDEDAIDEYAEGLSVWFEDITESEFLKHVPLVM